MHHVDDSHSQDAPEAVPFDIMHFDNLYTANDPPPPNGYRSAPLASFED